MAPKYISIQDRLTTLLSIYNKYPPEQQLILQLFSIFNRTSLNHFMMFLIHTGKDHPAVASISGNTIHSFIKGFIRDEILSNEFGDSIEFNPLIHATIYKLAQAANLFTTKNTLVFINNLRSTFYSNNEYELFTGRYYFQRSKTYVTNQIAGLNYLTYKNFCIRITPTFDPEDIKYLDNETQAILLALLLLYSIETLDPVDNICRYASDFLFSLQNKHIFLSTQLCSYLLFRGELEHYTKIVQHTKKITSELDALYDAITGNIKDSSVFFSKKKQQTTFHTPPNELDNSLTTLIAMLVCLHEGNDSKIVRKGIRSIQTAINRVHYNTLPYYFSESLTKLIDHSGLLLNGSLPECHHPQWTKNGYYRFWVDSLVYYWRGLQFNKSWYIEASDVFNYFKTSGFIWPAFQMADLIDRVANDKSYLDEIVPSFTNNFIPYPLSLLLTVEQPWQRALKALAETSVPESKETAPPEIKYTWKIDCSARTEHFMCYLFEHKRLKNGTWNSGRRVSIRNIASKTAPGSFTEQDMKAISILSSSGAECEYSYQNRAIVALRGSDNIYSYHNPDTKIEITEDTVKMSVHPDGSGYKILFEPSIASYMDPGWLLRTDSPERLIVYPVTKEHITMATILGNNGLHIPETGKELLYSTINTITKKHTIISEVDGLSANATFVEPECKPVLRLGGTVGKLSIAALVQPVPGGKVYTIGHGREKVIETIDGKSLFTNRNLKFEKTGFSDLLEQCVTLSGYLNPDQTEATIEDPVECLEILAECKNADRYCILQWNDKKHIEISSLQTQNNLSLKVKSNGDWFEFSGGLQCDENSIIAMTELLPLLASSHGRFVPLDNNKFIMLSKDFMRKLERIRSFSFAKGKTSRIHKLAALALGPVCDDIDNQPQWKARVESMNMVLQKHFTVPSTFEGTLRDYQVDGFMWLARLAEIGAGACLADDMGLGKTIQTIALMLHRINQGPVLIIAPTSVCKNWVDEISKFAPCYTTVLYSETERNQCITDASSGTAVICSYGLMNLHSEILTSKEWGTIILDEAQAIKNFATQRSKTVMELNGKFRMVVTGTPLENHLGELWNIFSFINPGLLGTIQEFNERFGTPIQVQKNNEARQQLKMLISPFILRRLKNQVLDELPPKTETIIYVEPSKEEIALYESLRRQAIQDLADGTKRGQHIKILAHIMKLRRACCHPSLIISDSPPSGSKLEAFGECVDELLDNKHRALVFSQFTDHLDIIKNYCDKKEIRYQYLDGSTPAAERSKRIAAFQSGDGSLFLMSLKAGGVGINLTSADYVLMLDPWWNPAVEDQAAARAHRMGQSRPVTIYRFITKGTIEEKIIELHKSKRDLAENLLDGSDMSGKMNADELMKLIKDSIDKE